MHFIKTSVCRKIIQDLNVKWVVIINQDSYYKGLPDGVDPHDFNFDHPGMPQHHSRHQFMKTSS